MNLTSHHVVVVHRGATSYAWPGSTSFSADSAYLAYSTDAPSGGLKLRVYDIKRRRTATLAHDQSIGNVGMGEQTAAYTWAHYGDRILFTLPPDGNRLRAKRFRVGVSGAGDWTKVRSVTFAGSVGYSSPPVWSWNDGGIVYYSADGTRVEVVEKALGSARAKQLALSSPGICTEHMCTAAFSNPVPMADGAVLCPRRDFDLNHVVVIRGGKSTPVGLVRPGSGNTPIFPDAAGYKALILAKSRTGGSSAVATWHVGRPSARLVGEFAWAFWG